MTTEEFGARVLGQYMRQAIAAQQCAGAPCHIVEYRDLKEPLFREMASWFGLTLPDHLSAVLFFGKGSHGMVDSVEKPVHLFHLIKLLMNPDNGRAGLC